MGNHNNWKDKNQNNNNTPEEEVKSIELADSINMNDTISTTIEEVKPVETTEVKKETPKPVVNVNILKKEEKKAMDKNQPILDEIKKLEDSIEASKKILKTCVDPVMRAKHDDNILQNNIKIADLKSQLTAVEVKSVDAKAPKVGSKKTNPKYKENPTVTGIGFNI